MESSHSLGASVPLKDHCFLWFLRGEPQWPGHPNRQVPPQPELGRQEPEEKIRLRRALIQEDSVGASDRRLSPASRQMEPTGPQSWTINQAPRSPVLKKPVCLTTPDYTLIAWLVGKLYYFWSWDRWQRHGCEIAGGMRMFRCWRQVSGQGGPVLPHQIFTSVLYCCLHKYVVEPLMSI